MERRPFGNAKREVPVIGMGTWYIDEAACDTAIATVRRSSGHGPERCRRCKLIV